ncbi:hypothetical protein [Roseibium sp. MMSF_3544]|uniref:hypothetical protein n=1 Tax=unclassified Roseibium TaxID=2629323 RepID=UPI00273E52A2|nr:hypothetical protein [Roseibium sp. MMSF_3544]
MLAYLLDGLRFLSREGSWSLLDHEAKTLFAAIDFLPSDTAVLARQQIARSHFIERQSDGRIPCFRYYRMDPDLRFQGRLRSGDHFIDVVLKTDQRKLTAKCVLHEGFVFGLEFPKPSRFFTDMNVEVVSVSCDQAAFSYTDVIDRAQHGREL